MLIELTDLKDHVFYAASESIALVERIEQQSSSVYSEPVRAHTLLTFKDTNVSPRKVKQTPREVYQLINGKVVI